MHVSGPKKTSLTYTKQTYSHYGIYLFFCVHVLYKICKFIEFLRKFCVYDEICVVRIKSYSEN